MMMKHGWRWAIVVLLVALAGCTEKKATPLPADYESFPVQKGQWLFRAEGVTADNLEKIPAEIEAVPGVKKGTVIINPQGRYLAFETTATPKEFLIHAEVADKVMKRLKEQNVKLGASSTR